MYFVGFFIGSCIIPFVICFVGGMIGRKIGAWIGAVVSFFLLSFGNLRTGSARGLRLFVLLLACAAMGWLCSWLACKIKDRNKKQPGGDKQS